jgi:hypothetical protein
MSASLVSDTRLAFESECRRFGARLEGVDVLASLDPDLVKASPQWGWLTEDADAAGAARALALVGIKEAARVHPGFAGQLLSALVWRYARSEAGISHVAVGSGSAAVSTLVLSPDEEALAFGGLQANVVDGRVVLSGTAAMLCPPSSPEVVAVVRRGDGPGGFVLSLTVDDGWSRSSAWPRAGTLDGTTVGPTTVLAELDQAAMTRVYDILRCGAGAALSGMVDAQAGYTLATIAKQAAGSVDRWGAQAAEHRIVDTVIDGDSALLAALGSVEATSGCQRTRLGAVAALCGLEAFGLAAEESGRIGQLVADDAFVEYTQACEALAGALRLALGGPIRLKDLVGGSVLGA